MQGLGECSVADRPSYEYEWAEKYGRHGSGADSNKWGDVNREVQRYYDSHP